MTPSAATTEESRSSLSTCHLAGLFLLLCLYRLWNAWWIQTQFDPDEYWQTLEPAYCQAFARETNNKSSCAYTWEWSRRPIQYIWEGPVRSFSSVVPTYLLYAVINQIPLDWFHPSTISLLVSKGPILLHAILVAAPTDLSVYIMGQQYFQKHKWWCLLCSVTCWFHGYALIRTYSNSAETALLAVGMALISSSRDAAAKEKRIHLAFFLGGWSVAIRFTSLAAWVPIGMAQQQPSWLKRLKCLLYPCATFGLLGVVASLLVDRYFYGFWAVPFLGNLHFNVVLGNGSLYGTHPWHWYLTAGVPAISGVMVPLLFLDLFLFLTRDCQSNNNKKKEFQSRTCLWIVIASYTVLHSCSAHKEFRFLMPVLPLICLLVGNRIGCIVDASKTKRQRQRRQWFFVSALIMLNVPHLVYLSMVHQRAPISVNLQIVNTILLQQEQNNEIEKTNNYSVHYLMGCHSTPLYSHLHIPSIQIDAWTLDCSPFCRSDSKVDCESDLFLRDPAAFVNERYIGLTDCPEDAADRLTCSSKVNAPDFLAAYAREADIIRPVLEGDLGLREVSRFVNGVVGAKYKSWVLGDGLDQWGTAYRLGLLELFVDEMVLFAKTGIL